MPPAPDESDRDSLMWSYVEDGEEVLSSESPAARAAEGMSDVGALFRALELPGEASDYHYALLSSQGMLMQRRDRNPAEFVEFFEQVCWHDIELLEARPDTIRDPYVESADPPTYYNPDVFETLARHYRREGFLRDALAVARRALVYGHGADLVADLEQRIRTLSGEHRG